MNEEEEYFEDHPEEEEGNEELIGEPGFGRVERIDPKMGSGVVVEPGIGKRPIPFLLEDVSEDVELQEGDVVAFRKTKLGGEIPVAKRVRRL